MHFPHRTLIIAFDPESIFVCYGCRISVRERRSKDSSVVVPSSRYVVSSLKLSGRHVMSSRWIVMLCRCVVVSCSPVETLETLRKSTAGRLRTAEWRKSVTWDRAFPVLGDIFSSFCRPESSSRPVAWGPYHVVSNIELLCRVVPSNRYVVLPYRVAPSKHGVSCRMSSLVGILRRVVNQLVSKHYVVL